MKMNVKILGVTFLIAIYCFAVFAISNLGARSSYVNHQDTEQIEAISKSLFHHTTQSKNSIQSIAIPAILDVKNSENELWLMRKMTDQFIETKYAQYCNFAFGFLIQYRKKDLIFPFHYFW